MNFYGMFLHASVASRNNCGQSFQLEILGPNLDLLCIRQLDAVPFGGNYAKLYFDAIHLEKKLNRVHEIVGVPFFIKVPFLANIGRCPNFLDKALGLVQFSQCMLNFIDLFCFSHF